MKGHFFMFDRRVEAFGTTNVLARLNESIYGTISTPTLSLICLCRLLTSLSSPNLSIVLLANS